MFPRVPKVEIFSRTWRQGWSTATNDVSHCGVDPPCFLTRRRGCFLTRGREFFELLADFARWISMPAWGPTRIRPTGYRRDGGAPRRLRYCVETKATWQNRRRKGNGSRSRGWRVCGLLRSCCARSGVKEINGFEVWARGPVGGRSLQATPRRSSRGVRRGVKNKRPAMRAGVGIHRNKRLPLRAEKRKVSKPRAGLTRKRTRKCAATPTPSRRVL